MLLSGIPLTPAAAVPQPADPSSPPSPTTLNPQTPPQCHPLVPPPTPQDPKNQDPEHGGQRIATALMYLSTPDEGGETVFPDAEVQSPQEGLSECAKKGLANK